MVQRITTQPDGIGTPTPGYADGYTRQLQGMYGLPDGRHVETLGVLPSNDGTFT